MKLPNKYSEVFIYPFQGLKTVKIKPIKNGFRVYRFSSYVATENIKIQFLPNGFSFAKGVYDKNYCAKVYFTEYFDNEGNEIKETEYNNHSVKLSRKKWLELQK